MLLAQPLSCLLPGAWAALLTLLRVAVASGARRQHIVVRARGTSSRHAPTRVRPTPPPTPSPRHHPRPVSSESGAGSAPCNFDSPDAHSTGIKRLLRRSNAFSISSAVLIRFLH